MTHVADRAPADGGDWVAALSGAGAARDDAVARLHELLLRGAHFELRRRRPSVREVPQSELEDLAMQATADAMVAILGKLHTFRGDSRFTTWAYKFALLEASVKARRRAWSGRELPLTDEGWHQLQSTAASPATEAGTRELLAAIRDAIATDLTDHQRDVLVALALNDVPIDVLAERLDTTRGALYKTLHDARRKLRVALERQGLSPREGSTT